MPIPDRLVVLVEGNRDESFVKEIIKPILVSKNKYKDVLIYKYAHINKTQNARFIRTSEQQNDAVLCMVDIDNAPCKSGCKVKVKSDRIGELRDEEIIVVIKEIESWLLAGLSDKCCKRLGISNIGKTNSINKEKYFYAVIFIVCRITIKFFNKKNYWFIINLHS